MIHNVSFTTSSVDYNLLEDNGVLTKLALFYGKQDLDAVRDIIHSDGVRLKFSVYISDTEVAVGNFGYEKLIENIVYDVGSPVTVKDIRIKDTGKTGIFSFELV